MSESLVVKQVVGGIVAETFSPSIAPRLFYQPQNYNNNEKGIHFNHLSVLLEHVYD